MDYLQIHSVHKVVSLLDEVLSVCLIDDYEQFKRLSDKYKGIVKKYDKDNFTISKPTNTELGKFRGVLKHMIFNYFFKEQFSRYDTATHSITEMYSDYIKCYETNSKTECNCEYECEGWSDIEMQEIIKDRDYKETRKKEIYEKISQTDFSAYCNPYITLCRSANNNSYNRNKLQQEIYENLKNSIIKEFIMNNSEYIINFKL